MNIVKDKTNFQLTVESLSDADHRNKLWNNYFVEGLSGLPKEEFTIKNITDFYGPRI